MAHESHHPESTGRFIVSIPPAVLKALDSELTVAGESRSAAVRRLIEAAVLAARNSANLPWRS